MSKFNWKDTPALTPQIYDLAKKWCVSPIVAKLLVDRDLTDPKVQQAFMHPDIDQLLDPMKLNQMDKAVDRIKLAIMRQERIIIYGDYDVDGITSTTIMLETLEMLGANVGYYIPDRFRDGYGPNVLVYRRLISQGAQLIITVDNGIAGKNAVDTAKQYGVDVVITDHHQVPKELPENAVAMVHPLLSDNYDFKDLCGAGVAFMVASALIGTWAFDEVDLACLGTIADVMPLIGENRTLVSLGLDAIHHDSRIGLNRLLSVSQDDTTTVNEQTIGFRIGPRLNAIGRLENANDGVSLLHDYDIMQAQLLAEHIDEINNKRRTAVETITDQIKNATTTVQKQWRLNDPTRIVLGTNWSQGVLGIVASRMTDEDNRPTLVLNATDDLAKGSGRSTDGYDLYKALNPNRSLMASFGGHTMACGLSVPIVNVDPLRNAMNKAAEQQSFKVHPKIKHADMVYPNDQPLDATYEDVQQLAPFGHKNPEPVFEFRDLKIISHHAVGKDKSHLQFRFQDPTNPEKVLGAIGFGLAPYEKLLDAPCKIYATLGLNTWNGVTNVQLMVQDIQAVN